MNSSVSKGWFHIGLAGLPCVLITTLAARTHTGERDLFTATSNAIDSMHKYIENRNGRWWVPNPAHEEENFADKWNEYPERREAFMRWHRDITTVLRDLVGLQGKGLDVVASRMAESFAPDPVLSSAQRYAERLRTRTRNGAHYMGSTGLLTTTAAGPRVRDHIFHGQDPDPRR